MEERLGGRGGQKAWRRTVFAGAVVILATPLGCRESKPTPAPSSSTTSVAVASSTVTPTTTPAVTATTSPFGTTFAYQPLWPFRSIDEVVAWQKEYRTGGHQPWHLDAGQTALGFASGYLGYTEIDKTTSSTTGSDGILVGVGYATEGSSTGTAAVVHLLRFGTGDDAPWEVVGTDDADLSLTEPSYGTRVTSPLLVGGRITGVDESIHVQVRQQSSQNPIGDSCCIGAGGEQSPWHATVTFNGATDAVLTVAASTGGHLQKVERFAVTAVRV